MNLNEIKEMYKKREGLLGTRNPEMIDEGRKLTMNLLALIPYLIGQIDVYQQISSGWRPIHTWHQPTDTEWVLVWGKPVDGEDEYNCHEVKWYSSMKTFCSIAYDKEISASHWMPLPEGPK